MIQTASKFIQLLKQKGKASRSDAEKFAHRAKDLTLAYFCEIARLDTDAAITVAVDSNYFNVFDHIKSADQFIELAKTSKEATRLLAKNLDIQSMVVEKGNMAQLMRLMKADIETFRTISDSSSSVEIDNIIIQNTSVEELIEMTKKDSLVGNEILSRFAVMQMISQKATVDQFIELLKLNPAAIRKHLLWQTGVFQTMLLERGMTADQFMKILSIDQDIAWLLSQNPKIIQWAESNDEIRALLRACAAMDTDHLVDLARNNRGLSFLSVLWPQIQARWSDPTKTTIANFLEVASAAPVTARKIVEQPNFQKRFAEEGTVDQFNQLVKSDKITGSLLAQNPAIQQMFLDKATLDQFIELTEADSGSKEMGAMHVFNVNNPRIMERITVLLAEQANVSKLIQLEKAGEKGRIPLYKLFQSEVIQQMIIKNATVEQFIELLEGHQHAGWTLSKIPEIRRWFLANATMTQFLRAARGGRDSIVSQWASQPDTQVWFVEKATIDQLILLADENKEVAKELMRSEFIQHWIIEKATVDQYIELLKINEGFEIYLRDKKFLEWLAKNVSFDQFVKFAEVDFTGAVNLFRHPDFQKKMGKEITLDRLVQLAEADEGVATMVVELSSSVKQLLFDPENMIALMNKSPEFARSLIAIHRSLQEILILNDIPEKHPELFGFLVKKPDMGLAASYGLKKPEEYHPLILFALGRSFLDQFTKLSLPRKLSFTPVICMELGALFLDRLHGIDATPSRELCLSIAMVDEKSQSARLTLGSSCQPKGQFFLPKHLKQAESDYKKIEEEYLIKLTRFFNQCRLNTSGGLKELLTNIPIVQCIYAALYLLDNERYKDKPRTGVDLTKLDDSCTIKEAIRELNYLNEHCPEITINPSEIPSPKGPTL